MSLKNEFIIKSAIYVAIGISIVSIYISNVSSQNNLLYLNIANISLLIIILLAYYKDLKKHIIINSIYDTQTKLYNRQYFLAELATTYERAIRYNSPLCILMISIKNLDKFTSKEKKIILKAVGASMLTHTRQSDIVCRYDEDKIAMLLPMTDYINASIAKDRLRNYLLNLNIEEINTTLKYDFTIVQNHEEESADEFLVRCIEATLVDIV